MERQKASAKTALLITAHSKVETYIKSILSRQDITLCTEYRSLSSARVIRDAVTETGNTVFIRKSFSRCISDRGLPSLLLMDYRLYLGPDPVSDHDHRKLLRTFFISYIIMLHQSGFDRIFGNFILFASNKDLDEAREFEKNPIAILDILKTTNEEINNFITILHENPEQFNRAFSIRVLPYDRITKDLDREIYAVINKIPRTEPAADPDAGAPSPDQQAAESTAPNGIPPVARVLYRLDEVTVFIDGKKTSVGANRLLGSLVPGEFYVIGSWEKRNHAEVSELLRGAILKGFNGKRFSKDDEIIINLGDSCSLDGTVISSLARLFTGDLAAYSNKIIRVNFKNAGILENAAGYIMIKKFVRHSY